MAARPTIDRLIVNFPYGVPARHWHHDWTTRLFDLAFQRLCAKMATGSGKTVILAMVIARHALNSIANPRDIRPAGNHLSIARPQGEKTPVRSGAVSSGEPLRGRPRRALGSA